MSLVVSIVRPVTTGVERLRVPVALAIVAVSTGYLSVGHIREALFLPLLPLVLYGFLNPVLAVALAVSLLPVQHAVLGSEGRSVIVSPADTLFLLSAAGLFPLVMTREEWRVRLRGSRAPVMFAVPFLALLFVVLAAHLSGHSAFKTLTAVEITVFPLVLGASVLDRRHARIAMGGFVLLALPLATLWITGSDFGYAGNKNGTGQYLSVALLLSIVLAAGHPWRYAAVPVLFVGMLYTVSRGALIGTAMGAIVLLAVRGLGSWRRTAAAAFALTAVVIVGFNTVPTSVQARLVAVLHANGSIDQGDTSRLSDVQRKTNYNLSIRTQYRKDAFALIRQHPWLGVGTGNYRTGTGDHVTADPHNLLLRTTAEGGYPDTVAFLVFVGGTTLLVLRKLGSNPWAGPALAIQAATFTHGMVDVYWIRGIPVLGWLLVGMALNPLLDQTPRAEPAAA